MTDARKPNEAEVAARHILNGFFSHLDAERCARAVLDLEAQNKDLEARIANLEAQNKDLVATLCRRK